MNERIREIVKQADKWAADEYHQLFLANINPNRKELFNKRFAELLIRECGVALSPMLRDMVSRGKAYDLIKKHFGVE